MQALMLEITRGSEVKFVISVLSGESYVTKMHEELETRIRAHKHAHMITPA